MIDWVSFGGQVTVSRDLRFAIFFEYNDGDGFYTLVTQDKDDLGKDFPTEEEAKAFAESSIKSL